MQAGAGGGKYVMRDLMRVLEQEKHAYTDPVTEVNIIPYVHANRPASLVLFQASRKVHLRFHDRPDQKLAWLVGLLPMRRDEVDETNQQ